MLGVEPVFYLAQNLRCSFIWIIHGFHLFIIICGVPRKLIEHRALEFKVYTLPRPLLKLQKILACERKSIIADEVGLAGYSSSSSSDF